MPKPSEFAKLWASYVRPRHSSKDESNFPHVSTPLEREAADKEYAQSVRDRKRTADLTEAVRRAEVKGLLRKGKKERPEKTLTQLPLPLFTPKSSLGLAGQNASEQHNAALRANLVKKPKKTGYWWQGKD